MGSVLTNKRPVFRSRDLTNQRPVFTHLTVSLDSHQLSASAAENVSSEVKLKIVLMVLGCEAEESSEVITEAERMKDKTEARFRRSSILTQG